MPTARRQLKTFDAVVKVLGGESKVGRLCDGQKDTAVYNWKRRRKTFPTKYWPVMKRELDARGVDAPMSLWGFYEGE